MGFHGEVDKSFAHFEDGDDAGQGDVRLQTFWTVPISLAGRTVGGKIDITLGRFGLPG